MSEAGKEPEREAKQRPEGEADKPGSQVSEETEAEVAAAAAQTGSAAAEIALTAPEAGLNQPAAAEPQAAAKEAEPPAPADPRQERLAELAALLNGELGEGTVLEAALNELDGGRAYLRLEAERLAAAARLLRDRPELAFDYLRGMAGTDYETHLEVVYILRSLASGEELALKARTDREAPSIPSITPVWATANWHEREIYDLLGIEFPGHPDLRRILLPDDWVGYPLRKDYEPLDPEV
ncbi:NADH-quinone oxidoreductase subunit C [Gorillibacterium sp. sgz500922]|uniref:NADH-quinone oxidoreductase subunit C n=1 Tax=Gorillibacterium sp. sgz500922 TaxID=3446694 RepID=UPI003F67C12E